MVIQAGVIRQLPAAAMTLAMMTACALAAAPAYAQVNRLPEAYRLYQYGNGIYQRELNRQGRGQQYAPIGTPQWFNRYPTPQPAPQMRRGIQNFAPLYQPFRPLYGPMTPPNPYRRW